MKSERPETVPSPQKPEEEKMETKNASEETVEQIMELWRQLPAYQQEQVLIDFVRDTDIGRTIADGGLPSIPSHMWRGERPSGK